MNSIFAIKACIGAPLLAGLSSLSLRHECPSKGSDHLKPEIRGFVFALLSSAIGGTAIVATRSLVATIDPIALGALRFGIGVMALWPIAVLSGERWPTRSDLPSVVALGLLFFAVFPVLFNVALSLTTAARGALTLSTLPLLTMALGAALKFEKPTIRKLLGAIFAVGSMAGMLRLSLADAPVGAWRGDVLMVAAALCMAFYTCWSRPLIDRSGPLSFVTVAMATGALALVALTMLRSGPSELLHISLNHISSIAYLGIFCGALVFWLWSAASARAAPSTVALSVLANPIVAMALGAALLGERPAAALIGGTACVAIGIAVAVYPDARISRH